MIDNLRLLDELFSGERIRLCRGHLFDVEAAPKKPDFDFDRIEGMLLGLASRPCKTSTGGMAGGFWR